MRILRIGLMNLNSLRGVHSVDLENGPLADAGIFAITGPTGAGKSTLLDAVTLALYGRAARYGKTPNPADMMSRHTGSCSAEVEFVVPGGRFRAEWQLNRARKDPAGNLQPAKRFLYDAAGTPITQKMREVDAHLEELIGLDYERFLRSAMLAQGDFARFLKADANERSELLESLTGTQIYSRLSVICHEEGMRRDEAFRVREQSLGEMVLLEKEARDLLVKEAAELKAGLVKDKAAAEVLRTEIERGRQLSLALEKQQKLREAAIEVQAETRRQSGEFEKLKSHRKAAVFLPSLAKLEQREQTLADAEKSLATAQSQAEKARVELRSALEVARLGAEKTMGESDVESKKWQLAVKAAEDELAALIRWQEKHQADKGLAAILPAIASALTELVTLRAEMRKLKTRQEKTAAETKRLSEERGELEKASKELEKKVVALNAEFENHQTTLNAALDGKTVEQMQAEFEKLTAQHEASVRLARLLKRKDALALEAEKWKPEHRRVSDLLTAKKEVVECLRETLESARLVARFEEHRANLKPGESCPLCGALEHPFDDPDKRPSDRDERWKSAQKEVLDLEKQEREMALALSKNEEALRGVNEDCGEQSKLLTGAPENLEVLVLAQKEQISRAQLAGKVLEAVEKSRIGRKGEFEKVVEQLSGMGRQLEKLAADEQMLTDDITECITKGKQQSAALAEFEMDVPKPGLEAEFRKDIEARAELWRAQDEKQKLLTTQISDANAAILKADERMKLFRDQADGYLGAVRAEGLEDVALSGMLPGPKNIEAHLKTCGDTRSAADATVKERAESLEKAETVRRVEESALLEQLKDSEFANVSGLRSAMLERDAASSIEALEKRLATRHSELGGQQKQVDEDLQALRVSMAPQGDLLADKESEFKIVQERIDTAAAREGTVKSALERDDYQRKMHKERTKMLADERERLAIWQRLRELIGSHDGRKFRTFAQGLSLDVLLRHSNCHLAKLTDRYELRRVEDGALQLEILDLHQANARRPMESLSGGESFLASLALALGLSDLAGRKVRIDTLFIDEGFGALDPDTLDVAVAALESLRSGNKTVGVVSHVELLKERIGAQLRVQPGPGGISTIEAVAG